MPQTAVSSLPIFEEILNVAFRVKYYLKNILYSMKKTYLFVLSLTFYFIAILS